MEELLLALSVIRKKRKLNLETYIYIYICVVSNKFPRQLGFSYLEFLTRWLNMTLLRGWRNFQLIAIVFRAHPSLGFSRFLVGQRLVWKWDSVSRPSFTCPDILCPDVPMKEIHQSGALGCSASTHLPSFPGEALSCLCAQLEGRMNHLNTLRVGSAHPRRCLTSTRAFWAGLLLLRAPTGREGSVICK